MTDTELEKRARALVARLPILDKDKEAMIATKLRAVRAPLEQEVARLREERAAIHPRHSFRQAQRAQGGRAVSIGSLSMMPTDGERHFPQIVTELMWMIRRGLTDHGETDDALEYIVEIEKAFLALHGDLEATRKERNDLQAQPATAQARVKELENTQCFKRIRELEADNARLTEERDHWQALSYTAEAEHNAAQATIAGLRDELEHAHKQQWWHGADVTPCTRENCSTFVALTDSAALAASYTAAVRQVARDPVYRERNRLVLFVASIYPSHVKLHPPDDAAWEADTIICVHGPAGQMTWHVHDSEASMFDFLNRKPDPFADCVWDRHTTEEKYERLASCRLAGDAAVRAPLEAEIARLTEALEWYAESDHWQPREIDQGEGVETVGSEADYDFGTRAKEALTNAAPFISKRDAMVRAQAREEACRAMCSWCARGVTVDVGKHFVNDGLQPKGRDGRYVECCADPIRRLP